MDALFGVPMDAIMVALLVLLGLCLGSIAYVAVRNRIIFLMGLRNIRRRRAQTALIIVGLMLSTLIISAAFATGDTVNYSVSNEAFQILGHVDITVEPLERKGRIFEDSLLSAGSSGREIPGETYKEFLRAMEGRAQDLGVDGYVGVLFEEVPVVNPAARLSEPVVTFVGLDAERAAAFPDVIAVESGRPLAVSSLGPNELFINESAAQELDAGPGHRIEVYINNLPHGFTVAGVVRDTVLTGARGSNFRQGIVTRLDTLHEVFGHDRIDFVAASLDGGVRDTLARSEQAEAALESLLDEEGLGLAIGETKRRAVELAEQFSNFMTTFFLLLGLFSIAAGMLLIVMIFVMLAAERKPEMGMARAVGLSRNHLVQMFMSEGTAYNLLAAMVGAGLGVLVAFGMAYLMSALFTEFGISVTPHVTPRTFAVSYSLGVVLTFLTVAFSSWRISKLNIVSAIRDIPEAAGKRMGRRGLVFWALIILFGIFLFVVGIRSDDAFPFALGLSLVAGGGAVLLRFAGVPERPVFTVMGVLLVVLWGLTVGGRLDFIFGRLEGDIEMFFLSGVAMVTAATFVAIYNADIILAALSRAGGFFRGILPAMKMAVAYPLHNKFRTGMTMAMISLVVFALTMMSAMNLNFDRLFLADEARGGWDVLVTENPNNPIDDLETALRSAGSSVPDGFRAVGRISVARSFGATEVRELDGLDREFEGYPVKGVDASFVLAGSVPLSSRAVGFDDDPSVWDTLRSRDNVAIVDGFVVQSGGFADQGFEISGIDSRSRDFEPIRLEIRDPLSGNSRQVKVIGVIDFGSSASFQGVFVPERTFREVFGEPDLSLHYVALERPESSRDVAKEIESTLLAVGVQADSLRAIVDREQALSRNFFHLMQGFMGLGLFVGIAAVGVIAFRTVVERRQQIGMLRAIGYKRGMVALSFILESSFVTLLGVAAGVLLAVWLSYFLITSEEFPGNGNTYYLPWLEIISISLFTLAASVVMTFIPSRQAASVPTAEALRYE
jgi:putative ABC transport system permease protein